MIDNIIDQLRRDEGVRYRPYQDSKGNWTIGVGHLIRPTENFSSAVALSDGQVNFILRNDLDIVLKELSTLSWYAGLDPIRQAACQNMGFNMGESRLLGFKHMEAALLANDWQAAHDQALASDWAKEPPIGVGDRAKRVAQQLLTGEWV